MKNVLKIFGVFIALSFMAACSPKIGSREWCEEMDEKPKAEWTVNEGRAYGGNCIIRKSE